MLSRLFWQIVIGFLTLFLAFKFIPGVNFTGPIFPINLEWEHIFKTLLFAGVLLGILNSFIKPILNIIGLPLKILTLNLFSFVISAFLIWLVVFISPELTIEGLKPLLLTTLILWGITFVLSPKQK
ncbi:MAG: phage holin family protein [Patescibacteria group bacterium]